MYSNIGQRIAVLLREQNIRQKDFADQIGISESMVSKVIKGERGLKAEELTRAAAVLRTTTDYLLSGIVPETSFNGIKLMLAKKAGNMTSVEKKELINILLQDLEEKGIR